MDGRDIAGVITSLRRRGNVAVETNDQIDRTNNCVEIREVAQSVIALPLDRCYTKIAERVVAGPRPLAVPRQIRSLLLVSFEGCSAGASRDYYRFGVELV